MDELGKAQDLIRGVSSKITSNLTSSLDECQACIDQCHGNVCGHGHLHMDQVQTTLDKLARKIDQFLITKIATCYNLLARFGVVFVSDEELHQGAGAAGRPQTLPGVQQPQSGLAAAAQVPASAPGPQPYPEQALTGLPAQAVTQQPRTGSGYELAQKPPPKYQRGADCCEWWIVWWEWFYPRFWAWLQGHHDCIPVTLCPPDQQPQTSAVAVPLLKPALPFWIEREVGLPVSDIAIQGE
jgi:hypothetical protein